MSKRRRRRGVPAKGGSGKGPTTKGARLCKFPAVVSLVQLHHQAFLEKWVGRGRRIGS